MLRSLAYCRLCFRIFLLKLLTFI